MRKIVRSSYQAVFGIGAIISYRRQSASSYLQRIELSETLRIDGKIAEIKRFSVCIKR